MSEDWKSHLRPYVSHGMISTLLLN